MGAVLQGLKCSSLWHGLYPLNTHGVPPPQLGQLKASTGSSVGKESTCNAGHPGSTPGWGSSRAGISCPHQYSWASLVTQLVKNPPAMRKTWVGSLGREDPLQEGMATHSSVLAWRIPKDRGGCPWGRKESDTTERLSKQHSTVTDVQ